MALMTFSQALEFIKKGKPVFRDKWGQSTSFKYLELHKPVDTERNTEPYIRIIIDSSWKGSFIVTPWTPTHEDLLAEDWQCTEAS